MYDNFTETAKKVLQFAEQEAIRLNHDYISTEHLLLGLTKVRDGVAVKVFTNLDVDLGKIRNEIEKMIEPSMGSTKTEQRELTPAAHETIKYAAEEATHLNHELWIQNTSYLACFTSRKILLRRC
jgi:ATP-dependent Clp protease ATP-binding subunit ClpC